MIQNPYRPMVYKHESSPFRVGSVNINKVHGC